MTRTHPIKVLQVIGALGMGGAETWLMEVLRLWSRTGAGHLDFLITNGDRGIFDDEAARLGAKIHYLRYGRAHLARFVTQFRRILAEGQYDAIHDHSDYASGWHFLMGAGLLPPVRVTHVHNPWLHIAANYAVSPSRRLSSTAGKQFVHALASHVCGTSEDALNRYGFHVGRGRPDVSVVHCGIDVAKFNAPREADRQSVLQEFEWPESSRIVLFAGRLDRTLEFDHPQNHKNSWLAANVVRAAANRDPEVRFLMAGAGDAERTAIERHVGDWGLERRIRLLGVRLDIPRLMRAADVLFFPSRQEGLGMVAVEAQAVGLPVLASTAVPRECVVMPELYDAAALTDSIEVWRDRLLQRMAGPRPSLDACRRAVESSPFAIEHSARRLQEIYTAS